MNALLDEASTKTYLNADDAAELWLQGRIEQVIFLNCVLNGQIETFETKPVSFELLSVDRKVSMNVTASTADLLDIAIINLQEALQDHELGDGSLYPKLKRKLLEPMLARYHRWMFETGATESVAAFRKWVIQEAEFQTIAAETMHGLTGTTSNR